MADSDHDIPVQSAIISLGYSDGLKQCILNGINNQWSKDGSTVKMDFKVEIPSNI